MEVCIHKYTSSNTKTWVQHSILDFQVEFYQRWIRYLNQTSFAQYGQLPCITPQSQAIVRMFLLRNVTIHQLDELFMFSMILPLFWYQCINWTWVGWWGVLEGEQAHGLDFLFDSSITEYHQFSSPREQIVTAPSRYGRLWAQEATPQETEC